MRLDVQDTLPRAAAGAIVVAALLSAMHFGKEILVPVFLAVLLSFVLNPLVEMLRRASIPRGMAVAIVVASSVGFVALIGFALARQVVDLGNDLPKYEMNLRKKLQAFRVGSTQTSVIDKATATLRGLGEELERQSASPQAGSKPVEAQPQRPIQVEIAQPPDRPLDIYQRIITALLMPITTTAIVLILVVFILIQRNDIRDRVIRLVGTHDIQRTTSALTDAASRLSKLLLVQTALNTAFGATIALGLWMFGVPSPVLWGVFAGLMRFVPYIGAIFSAVFPILLAASVDDGWTMAIKTAALFAVAEATLGNFLEPWVQGHSTGLSPLAIVVSAILWTTLWGPIGLLISTPTTMCLVVLGRHIEGLAFLDVILGDEPVLAPEEIFYHRMLAGASAEAAEQAEQYLQTAPLVDYYDHIAIPGLQLAANDAARGALSSERLLELREAVLVLVEDLNDFAPTRNDSRQNENAPNDDVPMLNVADLKPEFATDDAAVLCIGVRPLDTLIAAILSDALNHHGIRARVFTDTRLSDINRLNLNGVKLVWVSSIASQAAPSQIRYVVRRLRRMVPSLLIFGGFWGDGAENINNTVDRVDRTVGNISSAVRETISVTQLTLDGSKNTLEKTPRNDPTIGSA